MLRVMRWTNTIYVIVFIFTFILDLRILLRRCCQNTKNPLGKILISTRVQIVELFRKHFWMLQKAFLSKNRV